MGKLGYCYGGGGAGEVEGGQGEGGQGANVAEGFCEAEEDSG